MVLTPAGTAYRCGAIHLFGFGSLTMTHLYADSRRPSIPYFASIGLMLPYSCGVHEHGFDTTSPHYKRIQIL
ncbi:hypothetical protein M378DRAFT_171848, partial [Amanita muscaria Koide BX008]